MNNKIGLTLILIAIVVGLAVQWIVLDAPVYRLYVKSAEVFTQAEADAFMASVEEDISQAMRLYGKLPEVWMYDPPLSHSGGYPIGASIWLRKDSIIRLPSDWAIERSYRDILRVTSELPDDWEFSPLVIQSY